MKSPETRNDWLTVAALAVFAMCIVTFAHEALGHGSVCVFLYGRILLLTSSLFRCDVQSGWIDPAGPATNLLIGTLALAFLRFVPQRLLTLRLLLILTAAFSYFWESGYVIRAMYKRDGDLYFFLKFLLGHVSIGQRWAAAILGIALFVLTMRITSNALLKLWPSATIARAVARTAWISATLGAALAASAYVGHGWGNLRDAVLEIGGASFPLLFIPMADRRVADAPSNSIVARDSTVIVLAALLYVAFVASLGRGIE